MLAYLLIAQLALHATSSSGDTLSCVINNIEIQEKLDYNGVGYINTDQVQALATFGKLRMIKINGKTFDNLDTVEQFPCRIRNDAKQE